MDTNRLMCFSVLAKTESIRKAAEILRITPSALSKMVKQLEMELEVPLLAPSGRGIVLTSEGRELGRRAHKLVQELDLLKRDLSLKKQERREAPIRVATFEVFSTHFLQVLGQVDFKNRKLIWMECGPGKLEQAIEEELVDFGITYLPIPHPGVEHVKITRILMGVYKRADRFQELDQEELPFVIPSYPLHGMPNRVNGLDGWPDDAYSRKVEFEVTLMETALELCRQGLCVGYFPSFVVDRHNRKLQERFRLVRHPYSKSVKRCYSDVFIVKKRDRNEDADLKWISKLIRMGTKLETED